MLDDPENWLPANRALALLDLAAERSDDFGVLLSEFRTFGGLGPSPLLLEHEKTMRSVLHAVVEYRRLLNNILHITIHGDGSWKLADDSIVSGGRRGRLRGMCRYQPA